MTNPAFPPFNISYINYLAKDTGCGLVSRQNLSQSITSFKITRLNSSAHIYLSIETKLTATIPSRQKALPTSPEDYIFTCNSFIAFQVKRSFTRLIHTLQLPAASRINRGYITSISHLVLPIQVTSSNQRVRDNYSEIQVFSPKDQTKKIISDMLKIIHYPRTPEHSDLFLINTAEFLKPLPFDVFFHHETNDRFYAFLNSTKLNNHSQQWIDTCSNIILKQIFPLHMTSLPHTLNHTLNAAPVFIL